MSATNLTPQERFKLTLAHQQPDRPPVNIWPTPEIWEKLALHFERRFGDRIIFSGMLGLQKTLTHGTAEECRREAERLVTVIGKDGGYIFEPANSVTKDVPLENLLAAYEVATGKKLL